MTSCLVSDRGPLSALYWMMPVIGRILTQSGEKKEGVLSIQALHAARYIALGKSTNTDAARGVLRAAIQRYHDTPDANWTECYDIEYEAQAARESAS